jgi:non-heme chloroperoxidase
VAGEQALARHACVRAILVRAFPTDLLDERIHSGFTPFNTTELATSTTPAQSDFCQTPSQNVTPERPMQNPPRTVGATRRDALVAGVMATTIAALPAAAAQVAQSADAASPAKQIGTHTVNTIISKDGTPIYYKDWGRGPVVTFSHGWPLNADAWDGQLLFLVQNGFRVIAHDRRGHGRSGQASTGNDMNGYADDLAAVIETLDLRNVTLVGHSTGGGEVVRYIGRHGTKRVAKAVLIAAVPPLLLKSEANPEGLPLEVFDSIRAGVFRDRSQFYRDLATQFYGANRPGAKVTQGVLDQFWLWSMQSGLKNAYESIKAFSETDFTGDLGKIDVPTLVLHGEDDQIVPVNDSARKSARLIKGAKAIYYPGAPHGLTATHQDQVNADLLAFLKA